MAREEIFNRGNQPILFISPMLPKIDGKGFQQILWRRIMSVPPQRKIHLVVVEPIYKWFAFHRQSDCQKKIENKKINIKFMYPTLQDLFLIPFYLISGTPLQVILYKNTRFKKFVYDRVNKFENDNCYVLTSRVFTADLNKFNNLLVDFVDSMYLNFSRRAKNTKNIFKKLLFSYEANRMYFWETNASKKTITALTVSQLDQSFISNDKCKVIPIGIDCGIKIGLEKSAKHVVFSGDLGYAPNIEALSYFIKKCWPAIRQKFPSMEFHIIGRNLNKKNKIRFEEIEGVTIVGEVEDMISILKRYKYSVAPMVSGSGMQFKIIEAMFAGPVVLATQIAIGNMQMVNKKHLFIVNSGKDFLDNISKLEESPKLLNEIKLNASNAIKQNYSWKKINKLFQQTSWFTNL